jgi:2-polyprenyl-3-methyl-5-hydroxy-6-metoxy-1,4-benzoquinol methylase
MNALSAELEERKRQEMMFHNQREKERNELDPEVFLRKYSNKRFYSIVRRSLVYQGAWLAKRCPGAIALDYCCGLGVTSIEMAKLGAFVYGIDISDTEIETARKTANEAGVADRTEFRVMDAENMQFENDMFDVIVCRGVLHHLNIYNAYSELVRVLKPTGHIFCAEGLGYNPLINLYRKATPHLRTAWEAEHILTLREIMLARRHFNSVKVKYFDLFTILALPFQRTHLFGAALRLFECIDKIILRIPLVQLLAWQMVFEMSEPEK